MGFRRHKVGQEHGTALVSEQPPAGDGYAMSKYVIAETDTMTWTVKSREVLIAFGGMRNSVPSKEVWISRDMGVNWQKGSSRLRVPVACL